MQERSAELYLLPPPRLLPSAELPPHLGGLELAPYSGELPDEVEFFGAGPASEDRLTTERAVAVADRVQKHDAFRKRLAHTRWTLIGAVERGERSKGEPIRILVVAYDYTSDLAVEFVVSEETADSVEVSEAVYQPPLTQSEIGRAVDLVRADQRLARFEMDDLVPMAIQLDSDTTGERANHRMLEVLFGCHRERLPRFRAIVDLSSEQVVSAGTTAGCGQTHEDGGQS